MKQPPIYEIWPDKRKTGHLQGFWTICLAALLASSGLSALNQSWEVYDPQIPQLIGIAVLGMLCCAAAAQGRKRFLALALLPPLPFLAVLLLNGAYSPWNGFKLWINGILSRWNEHHDGVAALFSVQNSDADAQTFSLLLALLCGELAWLLVQKRQLLLAGIVGFLLMLAELLGETFLPMSCALYLSGFLGLWMLDGGWSKRTSHIFCNCTMVLCLCAAFLSQSDLQSVTQLRQELLLELHNLRYGEDVLPLGRLNLAARLNARGDAMLSVRTHQVKSLYLRGFVGSVYEDGVWNPLPNSAYSGDWSGMIDWLETQSFDPLTQPSQYAQLSGEPEKQNQVSVKVSGASSYFLYTPNGLETVHSARIVPENDTRFVSRTVFGLSEYQFDERSSVRPSELTVTAPWVSSPVTEAQTQYCQAESVYREFVYQQYLSVPEELDPLIQELFWSDASTSGGIYSAVSQVRKTLQSLAVYTRFPAEIPEGAEPIRWFLTQSHRGNAVLYASAAVEAFRAYGIPARYVEGYYLPSSAAVSGPNAPITLTGHHAHAWVELYFDGIGWLPVDVTPGYYFNTVALQQMVRKPSSSRKTAALENDQTKAEDISDHPTQHPTPFQVPSLSSIRLSAVLLGLLAVLLLLLSALFFLQALWHTVLRLWIRHVYRRASPQERVALTQQRIFQVLSDWGYAANLGWNTDALDDALSQRFSEVEPGEYSRVCTLLEKAIYGGQSLEPYEERTLLCFLEKISASEQRELRKTPWTPWVHQRFSRK